MKSDLIGVIPAAGLGTRMGSLTSDMPKALIEVEGRTLLERAIETLKSLNVSRIIVVTGYRGEMIRDFLSSNFTGAKIEFAFQEQQLGLAHAVALAAPKIDSDFVLLCPDNIFSDDHDLHEAKGVFLDQRPPFLMVATVNPSRYRDRAQYFTSALSRVSPHVYEYQASDESRGGIGLASTGCTFFRRDALERLPTFDGVTKEHKFAEYINQLDDGLLYLLRGTRYDLSNADDIAGYDDLRQRLNDTSAQGVSAILMNKAGAVLLQQRDDNPNIRYPGHWALWGGTIEPGETAYAAARREILEEIGYSVNTLSLFREFVQNNKREFAFVGEVTASLDELTLSEGQGMDFVMPEKLRNLLIRPDDKETLQAFFGI